MSVHIDVVSYLLAVTVFSVGFLSNRLHATRDATLRQASDVSWRVREILARGDRLTPNELAGLVAVVRQPEDSTARLMRWVHLALLVAMSLVYLDAIRLLALGYSHSPDVAFLATTLFVGGLIVGVVGEVDARSVHKELTLRLSATTLGRIEALNDKLVRGDLTSAHRDVTALRGSFPSWGLLVELDAYVSLQGGDIQDALDVITEHLKASDDLYASSRIGAAASVQMQRDDMALHLLDGLEVRGALEPDDIALQRALRLRAGHLDELLDGDPLATDASMASPVGQTLMSDVPGLVFEDVVPFEGSMALDLRPDDFVELRTLLDALRGWNRRLGLATEDVGSPLAVLRQFVAADPDERRVRAASLAEHANDSVDGRTVEAIGLVLLAMGFVRPALLTLEKATSLVPKSPRVHWAFGVSCWRWGWADKAEESVERAIGIDPEDTISNLTRSQMSSGPASSVSNPTTAMPVHLFRPSQRLQLALIGVTVPAISPHTCERELFCNRLIGAAVVSAAVGADLAGR